MLYEAHIINMSLHCHHCVRLRTAGMLQRTHADMNPAGHALGTRGAQCMTASEQALALEQLVGLAVVNVAGLVFKLLFHLRLEAADLTLLPRNITAIISEAPQLPGTTFMESRL